MELVIKKDKVEKTMKNFKNLTKSFFYYQIENNICQLQDKTINEKKMKKIKLKKLEKIL